MPLIRYLARVTLISALMGGCSQSLFDANPGHEGESDASVPDGAPDDPDGGPAPPLPDDAVANFSLERQGGTTGRWNYMEIPLGASGTPPVFQPMFRGNRLDMFEAWLGTGSPNPAIVPCAAYQISPMRYEPCAGVGDRLLLETTEAPGLAPVLQWTAPATSTYRLQLDARIPDGFPGDSATFLTLSRNGQFDTVRVRAPAEMFEIDVELIEQDSVLLMALSDESPAVPVGVGLTISEQPGAGATCRIALGFDGEDGEIRNLCGDGAEFVEAAASTQPGDVPLPPGIPGKARQFVAGSSLQYQGAAIDHSREWTVQFWARLDETSSEDQWLLSDLDCNMKSGMAVSLSPTGQLYFEMAAADDTDYCTARSTHALSRTAPLDGTWHFYRITWSTSVLSLCQDGVYFGGMPVRDPVRDPPLGPAQALALGRRDGRPGSFLGQLADVRVFSVALPCL